MPSSLDSSAVEELRSQLQGEALAPGDSGYDAARTIFNAMVDRRPAVIARCAGTQDVVAALGFARGHDLTVAVRGGGHGVVGHALCDDGIVIDLSPMKGVTVDPVARTAWAQAGLTMAEFDQATQAHGLATTGGRVSTTGLAGFALGGGSGWLERKYGLCCDNLIAADVVTADGRVVHAGPGENPDLLWGLRGGGGNFGVVTSFEFRLHPVGPTVLAGLLLYRAEHGPALLRLARELLRDAPEELGVAFAYLTGPPDDPIPEHLRGRLIAGAAVCFHGPVEDGTEVIRPLREFGPPEADLVGPMPYTTFQSMLDDPPGFRNYWTADYLDELSDAAIDTIADQAQTLPLGPSQLFLVPWGGAIARVGEDETPLTHREAAWVVHPLALWEDPAQDARHIGWCRDFRTAMGPFKSGGVYLNFIGDEGQDRIVAAYGPQKYARLAELKARYDPDNVFHLNQNIRPARTADAPA